MAEEVAAIDNFNFYLKFAKPLVLNLPDPHDRVLAAAWVRKLNDPSIADENVRKDYLKLLLFVLHRRRLIGPFSENPADYESLEVFPLDFKVTEVARDMLIAEEEEHKKRLIKGLGSGDYPPYSTECSADLLEYAAAQDIPKFGVHAYYAISSEPVTKWDNFNKLMFPKGTITDAATKSLGPIASTPTISKASDAIPHRLSKQSQPKSSPPPKTLRSADAISPRKEGHVPSRIRSPLGSPIIPDERQPITWGSNLINVTEPPQRDIDFVEDLLFVDEIPSDFTDYTSSYMPSTDSEYDLTGLRDTPLKTTISSVPSLPYQTPSRWDLDKTAASLPYKTPPRWDLDSTGASLPYRTPPRWDHDSTAASLPYRTPPSRKTPVDQPPLPSDLQEQFNRIRIPDGQSSETRDFINEVNMSMSEGSPISPSAYDRRYPGKRKDMPATPPMFSRHADIRKAFGSSAHYEPEEFGLAGDEMWTSGADYKFEELPKSYAKAERPQKMHQHMPVEQVFPNVRADEWSEVFFSVQNAELVSDEEESEEDIRDVPEVGQATRTVKRNLARNEDITATPAASGVGMTTPGSSPLPLRMYDNEANIDLGEEKMPDYYSPPTSPATKLQETVDQQYRMLYNDDSPQGAGSSSRRPQGTPPPPASPPKEDDYGLPFLNSERPQTPTKQTPARPPTAGNKSGRQPTKVKSSSKAKKPPNGKAPQAGGVSFQDEVPGSSKQPDTPTKPTQPAQSASQSNSQQPDQEVQAVGDMQFASLYHSLLVDEPEPETDGAACPSECSQPPESSAMYSTQQDDSYGRATPAQYKTPPRSQFDESPPQDLPSPLKPPAVVPGYQTPPQLKVDKRQPSPPCTPSAYEADPNKMLDYEGLPELDPEMMEAYELLNQSPPSPPKNMTYEDYYMEEMIESSGLEEQLNLDEEVTLQEYLKLDVGKAPYRDLRKSSIVVKGKRIPMIRKHQPRVEPISEEPEYTYVQSPVKLNYESPRRIDYDPVVRRQQSPSPQARQHPQQGGAGMQQQMQQQVSPGRQQMQQQQMPSRQSPQQQMPARQQQQQQQQQQQVCPGRQQQPQQMSPGRQGPALPKDIADAQAKFMQGEGGEEIPFSEVQQEFLAEFTDPQQVQMLKRILQLVDLEKEQQSTPARDRQTEGQRQSPVPGTSAATPQRAPESPIKLYQQQEVTMVTEEDMPEYYSPPTSPASRVQEIADQQYRSLYSDMSPPPPPRRSYQQQQQQQQQASPQRQVTTTQKTQEEEIIYDFQGPLHEFMPQYEPYKLPELQRLPPELPHPVAPDYRDPNEIVMPFSPDALNWRSPQLDETPPNLIANSPSPGRGRPPEYYESPYAGAGPSQYPQDGQSPSPDMRRGPPRTRGLHETVYKEEVSYGSPKQPTGEERVRREQVKRRLDFDQSDPSPDVQRPRLQAKSPSPDGTRITTKHTQKEQRDGKIIETIKEVTTISPQSEGASRPASPTYGETPKRMQQKQQPRRINFDEKDADALVKNERSPISSVLPEASGAGRRMNIVRRRLDFDQRDPTSPSSTSSTAARSQDDIMSPRTRRLYLLEQQYANLPPLPQQPLSSDLMGTPQNVPYESRQTLLDTNVPSNMPKAMQPPATIPGWDSPSPPPRRSRQPISPYTPRFGADYFDHLDAEALPQMGMNMSPVTPPQQLSTARTGFQSPLATERPSFPSPLAPQRPGPSSQCQPRYPQQQEQQSPPKNQFNDIEAILDSCELLGQIKAHKYTKHFKDTEKKFMRPTVRSKSVITRLGKVAPNLPMMEELEEPYEPPPEPHEFSPCRSSMPSPIPPASMRNMPRRTPQAGPSSRCYPPEQTSKSPSRLIAMSPNQTEAERRMMQMISEREASLYASPETPPQQQRHLQSQQSQEIDHHLADAQQRMQMIMEKANQQYAALLDSPPVPGPSTSRTPPGQRMPSSPEMRTPKGYTPPRSWGQLPEHAMTDEAAPDLMPNTPPQRTPPPKQESPLLDEDLWVKEPSPIKYPQYSPERQPMMPRDSSPRRQSYQMPHQPAEQQQPQFSPSSILQSMLETAQRIASQTQEALPQEYSSPTPPRAHHQNIMWESPPQSPTAPTIADTGGETLDMENLSLPHDYESPSPHRHPRSPAILFDYEHLFQTLPPGDNTNDLVFYTLPPGDNTVDTHAIYEETFPEYYVSPQQSPRTPDTQPPVRHSPASAQMRTPQNQQPFVSHLQYSPDTILEAEQFRGEIEQHTYTKHHKDTSKKFMKPFQVGKRVMKVGKQHPKLPVQAEIEEPADAQPRPTTRYVREQKLIDYSPERSPPQQQPTRPRSIEEEAAAVIATAEKQYASLLSSPEGQAFRTEEEYMQYYDPEGHIMDMPQPIQETRQLPSALTDLQLDWQSPPRQNVPDVPTPYRHSPPRRKHVFITPPRISPGGYDENLNTSPPGQLYNSPKEDIFNVPLAENLDFFEPEFMDSPVSSPVRSQQPQSPSTRSRIPSGSPHILSPRKQSPFQLTTPRQQQSPPPPIQITDSLFQELSQYNIPAEFLDPNRPQQRSKRIMIQGKQVVLPRKSNPPQVSPVRERNEMPVREGSPMGREMLYAGPTPPSGRDYHYTPPSVPETMRYEQTGARGYSPQYQETPEQYYYRTTLHEPRAPLSRTRLIFDEIVATNVPQSPAQTPERRTPEASSAASPTSPLPMFEHLSPSNYRSAFGSPAFVEEIIDEEITYGSPDSNAYIPENVQDSTLENSYYVYDELDMFGGDYETQIHDTSDIPLDVDDENDYGFRWMDR